MRVVIKPIIKPVDNPTMNYREFEDVDSIASTMNGNYILNCRDGVRRVEFHLPENCYLIAILDDGDKITNINML